MPSVGAPLVFAGLGDVHGHLDEVVKVIERAEEAAGVSLDFVLQVGDLEAHRHGHDLTSMYAPLREKRMGDFSAYWEGEKQFPRPMYFIGGNHESYRYLEEGPGGMTLAPNIHYLGRVGMANLKGFSVAFLTGCYDEDVYLHGRDERASEVSGQDWATQHALACFTRSEVSALTALPRPHVLLVHEWPAGLVRPEDHEPGKPKHRRLRYGETGVPLLRQIVERTGPQLVLCGHRHRRYLGTVPNDLGDETIVHCLGEVAAGDRGRALFAFDGRSVQEVLL
jgi:Icc-related predicted phosphoesterase